MTVGDNRNSGSNPGADIGKRRAIAAHLCPVTRTDAAQTDAESDGDRAVDAATHTRNAAIADDDAGTGSITGSITGSTSYVQRLEIRRGDEAQTPIDAVAMVENSTGGFEDERAGNA